MRHHFPFPLVPLAVLAIALPVLQQPLFAGIRSYRAITGIARTADTGEMTVVLRKYSLDDREICLVVNPQTLETSVRPAARLDIRELETGAFRKAIQGTLYGAALEFAGRNAGRLQNSGITRFPRTGPGFHVTIDLCPSDKPLDRTVFMEMMKMRDVTARPAPMAIAVSGRWMEQHPGDLDWLIGLQKEKKLDVIWVNHSYHHHYARKRPLRSNFMLTKGTDIEREVLDTERLMLEKGVIPSVFFRFPGLVSNTRLFEAIMAYGLIPLGSDAWLGKNQWPLPGSIVLVHGTGNEPAGIRRFVRLMERSRRAVTGGTVRLGNLNASAAALANSFRMARARPNPGTQRHNSPAHSSIRRIP